MSIGKYRTKNNKEKWYVNIYLPHGQNRIRKYGFDKKKDAQEYELMIKTKLMKIKKSAYTLGSAFEAMMDDKTDREDELANSTKRDYRNEFRYLFNKHSIINKKTKLLSIEPRDLQFILDLRTEKSKGVRSLKFLKMFFRYLKKREYTDSDLGVDLHIKKDIKKSNDVKEHEKRLKNKRRWLNDEENVKFQKYLREMDERDISPMNKMQLLLAINTGLRDAETIGLQMRDIVKNEEKGRTELHIDRQYTPEKEYTKTKNKESRTVAISKKLAQELEDYINNYKKELYARKGWKLTSESPLFTKDSKEEKPMRTGHTNDILKTFFNHHKDINPVTSHGLRHSFASYLYNVEDFEKKDIALLLGHLSVNTTSTYTHTFQSRKNEANDKLDKINQRYNK